MQTLSDRLKLIKERIRTAERHYQRAKGCVQLLAVSKTQTVDMIRQAATLGQRDFGENYLQEALDKIQAFKRTATQESLCWHFIGQIQSNKTQAIAQNFDWAHSVDRCKIAVRLSQQRPDTLPPLNICLQINIDQESGKAGLTLDALEPAVEEISTLPKIKLRGLMAIPAARTSFEQQRQPFAQLRQALQRLNAKGYSLDTLSMGMSNDMEAAIAEGATMVRIGTAIFGPR